ncbi:hypothetical protein [uncultured Kordia sp.]|uniref:hypothetical protein n=1 Tax=uncultured Kordia sp. TaxID=507699 RepID=UPI00261771FB|nr:hypothetical protein [uncultured Kordia sp.]
MIKGEHLRVSDTHIFQKLQNISRNSANQKSENTNNDFTLILDNIQIITKNSYTQYTVLADHIESEENLVNYILLTFDSGEELQYLVKYPKVFSENGMELDYQQATMEYIDGDIIFDSKSGIGGNRPCLDGVQELVDSYQIYQCTQYVCSDRGHEIGDDSCLCGISVDCTPAYEECGWVTVNVWGCTGGASSGSGNDGTSGGGSQSSDDTNSDEEEEEPIETIPVGDFNTASECTKITNFLAQNPDYKNVLLYMNNYLHDAKERSYSKFQETDTITESIAPSSNAAVRMLLLPGKTYEAFAHVHYETPNTTAQDTYSIFSMEDLEGIAKILNANLATDNFVTFLASGKEQPAFYAMTITDKDKFLKFFHYKLNENNIPLTQEEINKFIDSKKLYQKLKDEYYDADDAVIKKDNTDNTAVLEAFLKMFNEADIGASVFKSDSSYSNFTNVTYDPTTQNGIKETPCN